MSNAPSVKVSREREEDVGEEFAPKRVTTEPEEDDPAAEIETTATNAASAATSVDTVTPAAEPPGTTAGEVIAGLQSPGEPFNLSGVPNWKDAEDSQSLTASSTRPSVSKGCEACRRMKVKVHP